MAISEKFADERLWQMFCDVPGIAIFRLCERLAPKIGVDVNHIKNNVYLIYEDLKSAQQLPEADGGDSAAETELPTPEGGSAPEGDLIPPAAA